MILLKIYCSTLEEVWKESPSLRMYLGDMYKGKGIFICEEKDGIPNLKLALQDYFFNVEDERYQQEIDNIWVKCANNLKWSVLNRVEL